MIHGIVVNTVGYNFQTRSGTVKEGFHFEFFLGKTKLYFLLFLLGPFSNLFPAPLMSPRMMWNDIVFYESFFAHTCTLYENPAALHFTSFLARKILHERYPS